MKKIISVLILAIILVSCALESEFSLPNNSKTEKELIGKWATKDKRGILIFNDNNDNTFSITLIDEKGKENIISKQAFTSIIKGYGIINLTDKTKEGQTINIFYGYSLKNKFFRFREVTDIKDKKFKSEEELYSFFKSNIDKKDFFGKWEDSLYKD